jgi:hypothetical protein
LPALRTRPVDRSRRVRRRVAERSADTLGGAPALEQVVFPLAREQIGEAGEAIPDWFQRGDAVMKSILRDG